MIRFKRFGTIALSCILLTALSSCDEQTLSHGEDLKTVELDSNRTEILNVSGTLFSIPSPIQTAILIKKTKTPYNRSILNDSKRADTYMTNNMRALNLGVYGTDMAYASLFNDAQTALQFFKAIENLSNALEIKGAIKPELIKRLGSNVGNTDSLLVLSGQFYRASDAYLKTNKRYDVAALILTGGWVESAYLTALAAAAGNEMARDRLAAQKGTLNTLCKVLNQHGNDAFLKSEIKSKLDSLNLKFETIEGIYTYVKPETNTETKTTTIQSRTTYNLGNSELKDLSKSIQELRAIITQ